MTLLEAQIGAGQLETLDRLGFLTLRTDRRRQHVSLAHPLYGEILRARMPVLTRRRLLLDHADAHRRAGRAPAGGPDQRGQRAPGGRRHRPTRGCSSEPHGWPATGRTSLRSIRLGRAALVDGMTPEAGLLVGEALHELGEFDEADDVLTAAVASASDDDELLRPARRDAGQEPDVGPLPPRRGARGEPRGPRPAGGPAGRARSSC